MKRKVTGLFLTMILLSSCLTTAGPKPTPKHVTKEISSAKKIAVLGYNSSIGFDDRLLDNLKKGFFDITLDVDLSLDNSVDFPIGDINGYDSAFYRALNETEFEIIPKSITTKTSAYKSIIGDPTMEMNNVNAANGYTLTYKFNNWMDSQESVPVLGQVVNVYKDAIKDAGADLGVIVVHKPYARTKTYGLIPDQLFNKKKNYYTVSIQTIYYIIKPATLNQVLYKKVITVDSDKIVYTKGYTQAQRKIDEQGFLEQIPELMDKSHAEFVSWLKSEA